MVLILYPAWHSQGLPAVTATKAQADPDASPYLGRIIDDKLTIFTIESAGGGGAFVSLMVLDLVLR